MAALRFWFMYEDYRTPKEHEYEWSEVAGYQIRYSLFKI